jgi:hypothetical protein
MPTFDVVVSLFRTRTHVGRQPNPGTLVRSVGKLVGATFTLKVQSHTNYSYASGNSDLVVCLRLKAFDSWCRDGNFFVQITGCDGTMVQFIPASEENGKEAIQYSFMKWKEALAVASSIAILDEPRWFLRASTLPRPCTVRVFRQKFTLEDAIGAHACSLEALAGV